MSEDNSINECIYELIENGNPAYLAQVVYEQLGGFNAFTSEMGPPLIHHFILYENENNNICFLTNSLPKNQQLVHVPREIAVLFYSSTEFHDVIQSKEAQKRFPTELHEDEEENSEYTNDLEALNAHHILGCGICQSYEEEFYEELEDLLIQAIGEEINDFFRDNPHLFNTLLDLVSGLLLSF